MRRLATGRCVTFPIQCASNCIGQAIPRSWISRSSSSSSNNNSSSGSRDGDGERASSVSRDGCGRGGSECPSPLTLVSAECDMTFCPPERAKHCPLLSQHLPQPRGDESLHNNKALFQQHRARPLKCPHAYRALLVDAAGTLIATSESTQEVCAYACLASPFCFLILG